MKADLYEEVFKKLGIESYPVLLYKKDLIIADTVQLKISVTNSDLVLDEFAYTVCPVCGRKRYDIVQRGFFPRFRQLPTNSGMFKSREYFGTGASARKYIFFPADLKRELDRLKVKLSYAASLQT